MDYRTTSMRFAPSFILCLGVCLLLGACAGSQAFDADTFRDADAFIDELSSEGVDVQQRRTTTSSFFNRPGLEVRVNTTDILHIFEYDTAAEAERDLRFVDTNAAGSPSFYQRDNLVIVHRGSDTEVTTVLEGRLDAEAL